jgi:uncharacterized protein (TIGR00369 family)
LAEARYESCFACGKDNPIGLKLQFRHEEGIAQAEFCASDEFEGYPGIIHGGIISTLLDEAMAKAILHMGKKAVTAQLSTKLRKALTTGAKVTVLGWITLAKSRTISTEAKIVGSNGEVIASAEAVFIVTGG